MTDSEKDRSVDKGSEAEPPAHDTQSDGPSESTQKPSLAPQNTDVERTAIAGDGDNLTSKDRESTIQRSANAHEAADTPTATDAQETGFFPQQTQSIHLGGTPDAVRPPSSGNDDNDDLAQTSVRDAVADDDVSATLQRGSKRAQAKSPPSKRPKDDSSFKGSIPGFEVIEELGRGAFGVVYRARDKKLDREVAIKVPLLRDPKLGRKYIQEARNAAKIDANGIVPVFQVGSTKDSQPFVVQKLIDGSTLGSILERSSTVPVSWAISMLAKVAKAIGIAHESGLVHRDLKPDNILIDQHGEPWIADFGLAVFEEDQKGIRGEIAGTPVYMAPEQLSGRADWLDGRADIWAIGIILYKTLSGKVPFESEEFFELKQEILNRHPKPLSQRSSAIPTELDEIFNKCCAKSVTERFARAGDLANALLQVLENSDLPMEEIQIDAAPDGHATIRSRAVSRTFDSKSSLAKSTLIQQSEKTRTAWLGLALVGLALAGFIGFAMIWARLNENDDGVNNDLVLNPSPPVEEPENSIESKEPTVEPKVQTPPPPPPKPQQIVVSPSGSGTHTTLASAYADAAPDSKIEIEAGVYRESLKLDKNISLIGIGARDEVRIVGQDASALEVLNQSKVEITNLSIDASGAETNTIEVRGGSLLVKGCKIDSASWDCIKVHPGSSLEVSGTSFWTGQHPAIEAKQAGELSVANCDFRFKLSNVAVERGQPAVAIELTETSASISNSTFTGNAKQGKGISNRDSKSRLLLEENNFTDLLRGIELFRCKQVNFTGVNQFSECETGFYSEDSEGSFQDLDVVECKVGIWLAKKSSFQSATTNFRKCTRAGLMVVDSKLKMEQSQFVDNSLIGALIDCPDGTVQLSECTVRGNNLGILLAAGTVDLQSGTISQNRSQGIAVISYSTLPSFFPWRQKSGGGGPDKAEPQRRILAQAVRINGKKDGQAVLFKASGSYKLTDGTFVDFANDNRPSVDAALTTEKRDGETWVITR